MCIPPCMNVIFTLPLCHTHHLSSGAAPGELALEDLPAAAVAAGWSVDPLKVPLTAGDKKQVTFK